MLAAIAYNRGRVKIPAVIKITSDKKRHVDLLRGERRKGIKMHNLIPINKLSSVFTCP